MYADSWRISVSSEPQASVPDKTYFLYWYPRVLWLWVRNFKTKVKLWYKGETTEFEYRIVRCKILVKSLSSLSFYLEFMIYR